MEQTLANNGFRNWFGESVLLKLVLIGILTLLLLIPSSWIQNLIWERQERQEEVIEEISDKWSGSQLLEGPVMVLPYKTIFILEKSMMVKLDDDYLEIYFSTKDYDRANTMMAE